MSSCSETPGEPPEQSHDPLEFAAVMPTELQQEIDCWRCSKPYSEHLKDCPYCSAPNRSNRGHSIGRTAAVATTRSPAIVRVVWAFAVLAGFSLLFALLTSQSPPQAQPGTEDWTWEVLGRITVSDLLGTTIMVGAVFVIPVKPLWPDTTRSTKTAAWLYALPVLAAVLAINLGYHWWLFNIMGAEDALGDFARSSALWPALIVLICVQPAIVEEVFFRHVALGACQEVVSAKSAVLISSILFAMAHLGVPLSIPVLTLLGIALGTLRILSGGLLLPILFHFLHNLFVLLLEPVL